MAFSDATRPSRKIMGNWDKQQKLLDDIDKLVMWSDKWQMLVKFGELQMPTCRTWKHWDEL